MIIAESGGSLRHKGDKKNPNPYFSSEDLLEENT